MSFGRRVGAILAIALATPVRWLPSRWAVGLGGALGWIWYRIIPVRRGVARANLQAALGEAGDEAHLRGMYRHFGRSFIELLRFGRRPAAELWETLQVEGVEYLDEALTRQRGALILTAHLGNWELLVRAGTLHGRPLSVITKTFHSAVAEGMWRALRSGGPTLLRAGSARRVVKALERGELVAYVLDQNVRPERAVWVPFFGRPAATSPDLVRLAQLTGAPIVPIFTRREGDRHHIWIEPPVAVEGLDLVEGTGRCVARVEAAIRRAPAQWLWIHRRWKPAPAEFSGAVAAAARRLGGPGSV